VTNTNLTVADGLVVSLDYTLRLDDGQVIDTTANEAPLEFLQGGQQIIPGLEKALYGMAVGDEKDVELAPGEGYGNRNPDALEMVPREAFPSDVELTEGMGLQLRDPSGHEVVAYVAEIRPEAVVLDLNHPLAGETLFFEIKIADLRPATSEELDHGHAHNAGHEH
jgi:FKBP-type peptidyl-prolyl cis-trans isomerase SlyD